MASEENWGQWEQDFNRRLGWFLDPSTTDEGEMRRWVQGLTPRERELLEMHAPVALARQDRNLIRLMDTPGGVPIEEAAAAGSVGELIDWKRRLALGGQV